MRSCKWNWQYVKKLTVTETAKKKQLYNLSRLVSDPLQALNLSSHLFKLDVSCDWYISGLLVWSEKMQSLEDNRQHLPKNLVKKIETFQTKITVPTFLLQGWCVTVNNNNMLFTL